MALVAPFTADDDDVARMSWSVIVPLPVSASAVFPPSDAVAETARSRTSLGASTLTANAIDATVVMTVAAGPEPWRETYGLPGSGELSW